LRQFLLARLLGLAARRLPCVARRVVGKMQLCAKYHIHPGRRPVPTVWVPKTSVGAMTNPEQSLGPVGLRPTWKRNLFWLFVIALIVIAIAS
jgi:hypothetical protein